MTVTDYYLLFESYTVEKNTIGVCRRRVWVVLESVTRAPYSMTITRRRVARRTMPTDPLHIRARAILQMLIAGRRKTRRTNEIFRRHILFPARPNIQLREFVFPLKKYWRDLLFRLARIPARRFFVTRFRARGRNEKDWRGFSVPTFSGHYALPCFASTTATRLDE